MKNFIITGFIILTSFFLLNTPSVAAQTGSMMENDNTENQITVEGTHGESIDAVLQEMLNKHNVSTIQQLDLSKISDGDWERLGDAFMETQHPGQAHEVMDQMMGGEGSDSLRQMHINMGKAYLGYGGGYGSGMMGMMGGGMMGNWNTTNRSWEGGEFPMMGFGSMMGYGANSGVFGVLGGLIWVALIIFLVAGAYFFIKQAGKK